MKINYQYPFLLVVLFSSVLFAQNEEHLSLKQKHNTELISSKKPTRFGGRIMFDNAFFSESNLLKKNYIEEQSKSGNQFRRLFLYASGSINTNIEYKLQVNLINGQVALRDAFIGFKNIPVIGSLRLGQVKEPIRLSVLNSSNYLTFMERSFLTDFLPIRNSGVLFMNDYLNSKVSYQLGVFRNSDKNTGDDKVSEDGFVITGRFTGMPIQRNDEFLHVGVGGSYRKYDSDIYSVKIKPEASLSNISYLFIDGLDDVENVNIYNSEIAYGYKSLNFQGEYMIVNVNRDDHLNQFSTFYGQASWFLKGEHKDIKDSYSMFKRVKPINKGAYEVALRYSYVNIDDGEANGGVQKDVTVGLNWYLNSQTKLMFNQIYADIADKGNVHVSQIRVQVDF